MYKHLIADYILGYPLSTDIPFSAAEIGRELNMPRESIARIMLELGRHKKHWFDIKSQEGRNLLISRNPAYDDEMILWLTKGGSKEYFKLAKINIEIRRKPGQGRPKGSKLVFALSLIMALIRFLLIILVRGVVKNKAAIRKYVFLLKRQVKSLK